MERRGKPVEGFGEHGIVDLSSGVGVVDRGDYQMTSPPTVVDNTVVVGSSIGDNRQVNLESGVVRGIDSRGPGLVQGKVRNSPLRGAIHAAESGCFVAISRERRRCQLGKRGS